VTRVDAGGNSYPGNVGAPERMVIVAVGKATASRAERLRSVAHFS
jgi:hypothetical protein